MLGASAGEVLDPAFKCGVVFCTIWLRDFYAFLFPILRGKAQEFVCSEEASLLAFVATQFHLFSSFAC